MRMFFLGMMVALTPSLIVLAWTLRNAEDLSDVRESKENGGAARHRPA
jgi:hypothetical protein